MTIRRRRPLFAARMCAFLLLVGCTEEIPGTPQTPPSSVLPTESFAPRPPGVYLDVAVQGETEIVVHRIEFRRPVLNLTILVPVDDLTGTGAAFSPRIGQVSIEVPGEEPDVVSAELEPGELRTVFVSPASRSLVLRYVVRGAVRQSEPASAGRALALVSTLDVFPEQGLGTQLKVSGPVLNVGCSRPGGMRACGRQVEGGWTLRRSATEGDLGVFAQLDDP